MMNLGILEGLDCVSGNAEYVLERTWDWGSETYVSTKRMTY